MNIKAVLLFVSLCLLPSSAFADEPEESPFYGQMMVHDYQGDSSFYAQEGYFQIENDNGVAVWATGYRDSEFWSASAGLAKTWNNGWTVALGAGKSRFDSESHRVIAPWVGYESEEWEFLLSAEYYSHTGTPYYQGYLQRRIGDRHFIGVYGETGFGIGPAFTFGMNEHVSFRIALPVADQSDTKVLASLILTF